MTAPNINPNDPDSEEAQQWNQMELQQELDADRPMTNPNGIRPNEPSLTMTKFTPAADVTPVWAQAKADVPPPPEPTPVPPAQSQQPPVAQAPVPVPPPSLQIPPKSAFQTGIENAQIAALKHMQQKANHGPTAEQWGLTSLRSLVGQNADPYQMMNQGNKAGQDYENALEGVNKTEAVQRGQDLRLQGQYLNNMNRQALQGNQSAKIAMQFVNQIADPNEKEAYAQAMSTLPPNATAQDIMQASMQLLSSGRIHSNTLKDALTQAQTTNAYANASVAPSRINANNATAAMAPSRIQANIAGAANNQANTLTTNQNINPVRPDEQSVLKSMAPPDYQRGGKVAYADGGDVTDAPDQGQPPTQAPQAPGIASQILSAINPIGTAEAAAPQQSTSAQNAETQQQVGLAGNNSVRNNLNQIEKNTIQLQNHSAFGPEWNSTFTGSMVPQHDEAPGIAERIGNVVNSYVPSTIAKANQNSSDQESGFNLAARQQMDANTISKILDGIKQQVGGRVTNSELSLAERGQGLNNTTTPNILENVDRFRYVLDRAEKRLNDFARYQQQTGATDSAYPKFEAQWETLNPIDNRSGKTNPNSYPSFDAYQAKQQQIRAPQLAAPTPPRDLGPMGAGLVGFADRASGGLGRMAVGDETFNAQRQQHPQAYGVGQNFGNLPLYGAEALGAAGVARGIKGATNAVVARLRGMPSTPSEPPTNTPPVTPAERVEPSFNIRGTPPVQAPAPQPQAPAAPQAPVGGAPPIDPDIMGMARATRTDPSDWMKMPNGNMVRKSQWNGQAPAQAAPAPASPQPAPEGSAEGTKMNLRNVDGNWRLMPPEMARGGQVPTPQAPGPGSRLAMLRGVPSPIGMPVVNTPMPSPPKTPPYPAAQFYGSAANVVTPYNNHQGAKPIGLPQQQGQQPTPINTPNTAPNNVNGMPNVARPIPQPPIGPHYSQGGQVNGAVVNPTPSFAGGGAVNGMAHKLQLRGHTSNYTPPAAMSMPVDPSVAGSNYSNGGMIPDHTKEGLGGHLAAMNMQGLQSLGTTISMDEGLALGDTTDQTDPMANSFEAFKNGGQIGRTLRMPAMPNGLAHDRNQSTPVSPFSKYPANYAGGGMVNTSLNTPKNPQPVMDPGGLRGGKPDMGLKGYQGFIGRGGRFPGQIPLPTTSPGMARMPMASPVPQSLARGGGVPLNAGIPGVTDSVPAITNAGQPIHINAGEEVIRKSSADQLGQPALQAVNGFDHLPPSVQALIKRALLHS